MKELIIKIILFIILCLGIFGIARIFAPSNYNPNYPPDIGNCDPKTGCW